MQGTQDNSSFKFLALMFVLLDGIKAEKALWVYELDKSLKLKSGTGLPDSITEVSFWSHIDSESVNVYMY